MAFYLRSGINPFFKKNLVGHRIIYNSLLQNETQIDNTPYFLKHFKFLLQEYKSKDNENYTEVNELNHDHKSFLSKSLMYKNLIFTPYTSTQFSLALLSFKNLLNKTYNLTTLYNNTKFLTWFKTPGTEFEQNKIIRKFSSGKCSDKKTKKPKCKKKKKCKPKKKPCASKKPKKPKKVKCDIDEEKSEEKCEEVVSTCKKKKDKCEESEKKPEPCPKPCGKKKKEPKKICKKKKEPKKTCKKPCKKPKKKCDKPKPPKKKCDSKPAAKKIKKDEPKPCGKPKKPKCDVKKKSKKKSKKGTKCEQKSPESGSCPVKAAPSSDSCKNIKTPPPDIAHMRANSGKKSSNKDKAPATKKFWEVWK